MATESLDDLIPAAHPHIALCGRLILTLFQLHWPSLSTPPTTEFWHLATDPKELVTPLTNQVNPLLPSDLLTFHKYVKPTCVVP